jgi:hypothetical protein
MGKYVRKGEKEMASKLQEEIQRRQEYDVRGVQRLNDIFYQVRGLIL